MTVEEEDQRRPDEQHFVKIYRREVSEVEVIVAGLVCWQNLLFIAPQRTE